jgi:hypothetical protein
LETLKLLVEARAPLDSPLAQKFGEEKLLSPLFSYLCSVFEKNIEIPVLKERLQMISYLLQKGAQFIPKQIQELVFVQRESFRNSTIVSYPILIIWGDLRSSNFGALAPPKCQFLKLFGYIDKKFFTKGILRSLR